MVTVIKQAEQGKDIVIRMYEYAGRNDQVKIDFHPVNGEYRMDCGHHEIKTARLMF